MPALGYNQVTWKDNSDSLISPFRPSAAAECSKPRQDAQALGRHRLRTPWLTPTQAVPTTAARRDDAGLSCPHRPRSPTQDLSDWTPTHLSQGPGFRGYHGDGALRAAAPHPAPRFRLCEVRAAKAQDAGGEKLRGILPK